MSSNELDRESGVHVPNAENGVADDMVSFIVREASVTEEQARRLIERYGDEDPEKLVNYALHLIDDSEPKPGSEAGKV